MIILSIVTGLVTILLETIRMSGTVGVVFSVFVGMSGTAWVVFFSFWTYSGNGSSDHGASGIVESVSSYNRTES